VKGGPARPRDAAGQVSGTVSPLKANEIQIEDRIRAMHKGKIIAELMSRERAEARAPKPTRTPNSARTTALPDRMFNAIFSGE